MICHVDIESFSEINLTKVGVYRYAEHESTELLVVCYAFGDEPVCTWVPVDELPDEVTAEMTAYHEEFGGEFRVGTQVPFSLHEHMASGGELRAHNAEFERVMLNKLGFKYNIPKTPIEQWVCTAAKAAANGLPRGLGGVTHELGLEHQKNEGGRIVMLQLCKPRRAKDSDRWTPENAPDKFLTLYKYCIGDVLAERDVDQNVPDLMPYEQAMWRIDQEINERGVLIDVESVHNVLRLVDQYRKVLRARCKKVTGIAPSKREKLAEWIREQGVRLQNMQAATIDAKLKEEDLPKQVRRILLIRRLHEMKGPDKYKAMLRAVNEDDRIRGMFLYNGAATGRWAGKIVQLQNLARGTIKDPETVVEAYRQQDLDLLKMLWGQDPMKLFASTVRTMIMSPDGEDLLCMDYSSIEGRVVAWLVGDQRKLEIYRTHGLVYEDTAAEMFKLPKDFESLSAMQKEFPQERFLGKTGELACQYQGGKAAFRKMAKNYGVDIPTAHAEKVVKDWRAVNKKTVAFWRKINAAAVAAVADRKRTYKAGEHVMFRCIGDHLYMRLPSGRRLAYFKPRLEDEDRISYMGINTYTRQWSRNDTYGGRLTENVTQAIARDILANGIRHLHAAGYKIVAHIHDEVIIEDQAENLEHATQLMCTLPKWAEGLPVSADGFAAKRYRKE